MEEKNILTAEDCELLMKKFFQTENVKLLSYKIQDNDGNSFFINLKTSLEHVQREEQTTHFYKDELPSNSIFKALGEKYSGADGGFQLVPTCLIKEDLQIILADLIENECFFLSNSTRIMQIDHIKIVITAMAKYHARSMDCKEAIQTDLLQKRPLLGGANEILHNSWFISKLDILENLIDLLPEDDQIPNQLFKEHLATFVKDLIHILAPSKTFFNVVCCGYIGVNTILFKYSNGVPVQCQLMHLETPTYNPPTLDLLRFIHGVTNVEMRQKHYHELLQYYFGCLKTTLSEKGLDLEEILPLEEAFETSIQHLLPAIKLLDICSKQNRCLLQYTEQTYRDSTFEPDKALLLEAFQNNDVCRKFLTESILEFRDILIQPELTQEDCFKIIRNKVGPNDYELLNFKLMPIGNVSGFFGDHKKLQIDIRMNDQKQTLNLFVKFTPKGKAQKSIADDCGSFYKENFFYRHFVPMIQGFGITAIDECTVPCYFSAFDRVMIFEDFAVKGYATINHDRCSLNYETVQLVAKQLAKFHASSIIVEEKLSQQTKTAYCLKEHYDKGLQESFFNKIPNHQGAQSMQMSIDVIDYQMSLYQEFQALASDEDFKLKIKKAYEQVYELVKPSEKYRNALCHGDLWISNILMQHIDEKLVDCRFVDFQIMRYCPPAHDLLGFVYLTTNRSFREQYLNTIINLYHDELSKVLNKYGCPVENIYPYDHFLKSIEYMLPQVVCQTVIYYQICTGDPSLLKDYMATEDMINEIFLRDRRRFMKEMCQKDPVYKEKNKEALEDLRDLCFKYF